MTVDWLPDWRDESGYPAPNELSARLWAWQFLRRNSKYQADFESWQELVSILPKENGEIPNIHEDLRFYVLDPPADDGETYAGYTKRVGIHHTVTPFLVSIGQQYGLSSHLLPDPGEIKPRMLRFTNESNSYVLHHEINNDQLSGPKKFHVYAEFNLEWPIKVQIERVKKLLIKLRKINKSDKYFEPVSNKVQITILPTYLRILDANYLGVKARDIADVIFAGQPNTEVNGYGASKKVRTDLKRAKKLRNHGYRLMPLLLKATK